MNEQLLLEKYGLTKEEFAAASSRWWSHVRAVNKSRLPIGKGFTKRASLKYFRKRLKDEESCQRCNRFLEEHGFYRNRMSMFDQCKKLMKIEKEVGYIKN